MAGANSGCDGSARLASAWSTRDTLSATPAGMPNRQPASVGSSICATSIPTTWSGVKPTAFMIPISR